MWHSDSCQMLNNSVPAELDQIQQVEHASRGPNFIIKSRLKMSDIRYQEPSQEVKYNEVIFCEIKFRVWRAAGPRRPGAEQERSNRPNLNSSTWIWRNTQSKTHHSGSLCFYCPCFEAELPWWWRRYVFRLTKSGISGFCGVVSLPCALRSLSGTHSTDSLSRYNEQS